MRRLLLTALLVLPAATVSADLVVERTWPAELPIDPAPIVGDTWPALPPPLPRAEPATRAAARVLEVLARVEREQEDSRYQHRTDVRERLARYRWDCSGMVSWVLHRAAPVAARGIGGERTSARGIFRLITRAPSGRQRLGWEELAHIEDARPGDVFAWLTPPGSSSPHTGHTGFVLERPRPVPGLRDAYAIRIADSIVGPHQEDTRQGDPDGGLGTGVMTFLTDGRGHATHFGWHGTRTAGYTRTAVIFGRVHR
jgi:hypothetical protein